MHIYIRMYIFIRYTIQYQYCKGKNYDCDTYKKDKGITYKYSYQKINQYTCMLNNLTILTWKS